MTPTAITLPGSVEITDTGLVFKGKVTNKDLLDIGEKLSTFSRSSPFLIGDWILALEGSNGKSSSTAAMDVATDLFPHYSQETLKKYYNTSRAIPQDQRRASVSFDHHMAVIALSDELRKAWLVKAEELEMPADLLKKSIKAKAVTGVELTVPEKKEAASKKTDASPQPEANTEETKATAAAEATEFLPIEEVEVIPPQPSRMLQGATHDSAMNETKRSLAKLLAWYAQADEKEAVEKWDDGRKVALAEDLSNVIEDAFKLKDYLDRLVS